MTAKLPEKVMNGKLFDIESPMAIELRRIMIRLGRTVDFNRKLSLMVSSSESGEGKSLFSTHFSLVLAYHLQKSILLLDGDLRKPVQHTVFGHEISPGLGELLGGKASILEAVRKTAVSNLDLLPAGDGGKRPSRLFNEAKLKALVKELHNEYDIIILDSPPVVPVSDPLLFVHAVDGLIYMVMAGRTSREISQRGVEIFKGAGANILGVVANNLGDVLPYYYSNKYYGYYDQK
ncbi:MAG: CpsD/CapB family tyrosine-protein kinase [Gemmatimonadales bacterium]|nr:CpsD/CapB family tyrosine-protein kinase [Gemmatimonadales bacterium]